MHKILTILLFLSLIFAQTGTKVGSQWKGQPKDPLIQKITIYKHSDTVYYVYMYSYDGNKTASPCKINRTKRGIKMTPIQKNEYGEYWLLTYKGKLESWDNQGFDWLYVPF